jgi:hypothetical protein
MKPKIAIKSIPLCIANKLLSANNVRYLSQNVCFCLMAMFCFDLTPGYDIWHVVLTLLKGLRFF